MYRTLSVLCVAGLATSVLAQSNRGFETGDFTTWKTFDNPDNLKTFVAAETPSGIPPVEGEFVAVQIAGGLSQSQAEEIMGLAPGTLADFYLALGGTGDAEGGDYSILAQAVPPGTVAFQFSYENGDNGSSSFLDHALVVDEAGRITLLDSGLLTDDIPGFVPASVSHSGGLLFFVVANGDDTSSDPALSIDDVRVIGQPSFEGGPSNRSFEDALVGWTPFGIGGADVVESTFGGQSPTDGTQMLRLLATGLAQFQAEDIMGLAPGALADLYEDLGGDGDPDGGSYSIVERIFTAGPINFDFTYEGGDLNSLTFLDHAFVVDGALDITVLHSGIEDQLDGFLPMSINHPGGRFFFVCANGDDDAVSPALFIDNVRTHEGWDTHAGNTIIAAETINGEEPVDGIAMSRQVPGPLSQSEAEQAMGLNPGTLANIYLSLGGTGNADGGDYNVMSSQLPGGRVAFQWSYTDGDVDSTQFLDHAFVISSGNIEVLETGLNGGGDGLFHEQVVDHAGGPLHIVVANGSDKAENPFLSVDAITFVPTGSFEKIDEADPDLMGWTNHGVSTTVGAQSIEGRSPTNGDLLARVRPGAFSRSQAEDVLGLNDSALIDLYQDLGGTGNANAGDYGILSQEMAPGFVSFDWAFEGGNVDDSALLDHAFIVDGFGNIHVLADNLSGQPEAFQRAVFEHPGGKFFFVAANGGNGANDPRLIIDNVTVLGETSFEPAIFAGWNVNRGDSAIVDVSESGASPTDGLSIASLQAGPLTRNEAEDILRLDTGTLAELFNDIGGEGGNEEGDYNVLSIGVGPGAAEVTFDWEFNHGEDPEEGFIDHAFVVNAAGDITLLATAFDGEVNGFATETIESPQGDVYFVVANGFDTSVDPILAIDNVRVVAGGCAADCNQDGNLNILDFVCFQTAFATQSPLADCDDNGQFNILDFVCFNALFGQGCP